MTQEKKFIHENSALSRNPNQALDDPGIGLYFDDPQHSNDPIGEPPSSSAQQCT